MHSNYLKFCSNWPVKFAIFLKSSLLFNSFYCLFLFVNKTLGVNNFKTWTDMNAKISVFVICVEAIIYLLLYHLHDCTFKNFAKFLRMPFFIEHLRWLFLYKNHGFAKPLLRSALELLLPGKHYKVVLFENIWLLDLPKFCHSGNCCTYSKVVYSNKLWKSKATIYLFWKADVSIFIQIY